jgi:hypothetical protein
LIEISQPMTTSHQETSEDEFLSRLQSQFGDMDLTDLLYDKKKKQEGYESEDSSLAEPTAEELHAWQEAQFQKGQINLQTKESLRICPIQRRRDAPYLLDDDGWGKVAALPKLEDRSAFFPDCDETGNEFLGAHPLLQKLSSADPEVLGSKWKRLFSSAHGDGLSFQMLLSTLNGYGGPTVMLISAIPSISHAVERREEPTSIGFFTTSTWSESPEMFGSNDCFLFTFAHKGENQLNFLRPLKTKKNGDDYMYCNPSSLNLSKRHSKISSLATDGCVHGIGVGGTPSLPRLHLTETLEKCRAMEHCASFEAGELLRNGKESLYYFDVDYIEVWGVGGDERITRGLETQRKGRDLAESALRRVRKVDKAQFVDDIKFFGKPSGLFGHAEHSVNRTDM